MENFESYFEANKNLWNQRTPLHVDSAFYNREGFLKGQPALTPIERNEMGDVRGKKMLHLQCHFGMDSLDWERNGALVTGIDLSDAAIAEAEKLKSEAGLHARFVCCNLYDLHPDAIKESGYDPLGKEAAGDFDIVFTSYGTIGWLPELERWAEIISYYLKPGGKFYMAEFHPVAWMFDDDFKGISYSYENREVIRTANQPTYTGGETKITAEEYSWNHSLSEVFSALLDKGLQPVMFHEHMYSPYPNFRHSVETEKGKWQVRGLEGKIPLVYSLKAIKQ